MLLVNRSRKRVIHVPVLWLVGAAVMLSPIVTPSTARHGPWAYAFPALFLAVAAGTARVASRFGDRIRVWGVLGRTWLPARDTFVAVTVRPGARGGASINVELMSGGVVDLLGPYTT